MHNTKSIHGCPEHTKKGSSVRHEQKTDKTAQKTRAVSWSKLLSVKTGPTSRHRSATELNLKLPKTKPVKIKSRPFAKAGVKRDDTLSAAELKRVQRAKQELKEIEEERAEIKRIQEELDRDAIPSLYNDMSEVSLPTELENKSFQHAWESDKAFALRVEALAQALPGSGEMRASS